MPRILFIDDNVQLQKTVTTVLEKAGYDVIAADNGKRGLVLYRDRKPDLVITDLIMPDMDGVEMMSEMKKDSPDVKIIAISGGGDEGSGEEYLNSVQEVLNIKNIKTIAKPFEPGQLLELVKQALGAA